MIEQRSPEWFEQRKGRITGSSIGAILGCDPFRKPRDVMRAMVRQAHGAEAEFTGNIATEYGTLNEDGARFDFELETGLEVVEAPFVIHAEHDWLGASPDGFIGDDALIEIKCPFSRRGGDKPFKSLAEQPQYYAQIQIQLYCTGRTKCHFFQWSAYATATETVEFDQSWIDENLPKLRKFYDQYLVEVESPERHLADLVQTKEADALADRYRDAKAAMDAAKAEVDAAKKELIAIAGGKKTSVSGLLVYPIERKGSVKYAQVVKDHCPDVDLSKYTGKPSMSWGVK